MREQTEGRPSAVLFVALVLGLVAYAYWPALILAGAFAVWVRPLYSRCLIVGAFVLGLALSPTPMPIVLEPTPIHGIGIVASVPTLSQDSQLCEFEIDSKRLALSLPREPAVMLGDRLRVSGIVKPPSGAAVRPMRADMIQGRIDPMEVTVVGQGSSAAHLADQWRRSFIQFFEENMSAKNADLVDAICFNTRSLLDAQSKEQLASSGTIHIVSASGLQVFVFAMLLSIGLRFFPIPRSVQLVILGLVLGLYCLAAGLQPQIVRAAAMSLLGLTAYMIRREPDALSALSLSAFVYLLWRPDAVYGMAFQLSFVTVASIALFFRPGSTTSSVSKNEVVRIAYDFARISAIVMLATTPLVAYYLGVISPSSVFANLMVYWSLPLVVGIGFFAHGVSLVLPAVGGEIAVLFLSPQTNWLYKVIGWMANTTVAVPAFSGWWIIAFYGVWLMTYRRRVAQP